MVHPANVWPSKTGFKCLTKIAFASDNKPHRPTHLIRLFVVNNITYNIGLNISLTYSRTDQRLNRPVAKTFCEPVKSTYQTQWQQMLVEHRQQQCQPTLPPLSQHQHSDHSHWQGRPVQQWKSDVSINNNHKNYNTMYTGDGEVLGLYHSSHRH